MSPEILGLFLAGFLLPPGAGAFEMEEEYTESRPPCPFNLSVPIPVAVAHRNGTVWDPYGGIFYPPGTHWRWTWQQDSQIVESHRGCPCDVGVPCLLKCCRFDHGPAPGHCTHRDPVCPARPTDEKSSATQLFRVLAAEMGVFALFRGHESARVYRLEQESGQFFVTRDLCDTETFTRERPSDERVGYCVKPSDDDRLAPWFCNATNAISRMRKLVTPVFAKHYPYGRLLAIAALSGALVVYATFPKLRNFHGKVVVSHLISLLLGNSVLAAAMFLWEKAGTKYCPYFGIGSQYFYLAAFCWLNVMCVDIYITFRRLGPILPKKHKTKHKRFLVCSLYAWGFPLLVSGLTALLEWVPDLPPMIIRPNFEQICWFKDKRGALLYFFGPIGVTFAANVLLFVATSVKIFRLQRETAKWENRRSVVLVRKMKKSKVRFNMYLKLFLMMGVGRSFGLLFWMLDHPTKLFVVADLTEALQSILIFITYVWKDEVILLFKQFFSAMQQSVASGDSTDEIG